MNTWKIRESSEQMQDVFLDMTAAAAAAAAAAKSLPYCLTTSSLFFEKHENWSQDSGWFCW